MKWRWNTDDIPDQSGRAAVVTGANSGIGFETAKALAAKGSTVVLACRSEARGAEAQDRIADAVPGADLELRRLDLGDLASVEAFAAELLRDHEALDLLVNNAGVMVPPYTRTKDGFELQIGVNHMGHFALTGWLLPALARAPSARVVVVGSTAHRWGVMDLDDLHYEQRRYVAWLAYGQSKLANLLFTRELARRVDRAGLSITAAASHPGFSATGLFKNAAPVDFFKPVFGMPPWQGALPTLYAATDPDVQSDDYFGPVPVEIWGYPGRVGRSRTARDDARAERLWEISERATGVRAGDVIDDL